MCSLSSWIANVYSSFVLFRLESKVAIVTGAASGIGEEAVRLFAENGASVVVADVQDELGQKVVASIGHEKVSYRHCDVRDENQVQETVSYALEKYGSLDIFFSNAGVIGPLTGILDLDIQGFDNTMATNVRGAAATIKHAARAMVDRKICGSIICTTSVAASLGGAGPHAYTTSKHALLGLVRTACHELGKYGIRVNCISPFGVGTPLSCRAYNKEASEVEADTCAVANLKGIVLKARHVAEAALFLASDESAYISGHNLAVDGGFTAKEPSTAKTGIGLTKFLYGHETSNEMIEELNQSVKTTSQFAGIFLDLTTSNETFNYASRSIIFPHLYKF
ncbi:hypothetical protein RJ639_033616 [Escallonia herrerae]|uniref:Short-chain dehydrogenase reductase 3b-like n=1 Tax=Escallonia herrerae TaxID=1293975 RepID=A0AA88WV70_9ASTE|nr:hypothetical protein RJ639_033616 [Escallonia herrerae]